MICPNCNRYSKLLKSLFNGLYKCCEECNNNFLFLEYKELQARLENKIYRESKCLSH